MTTPAPHQAGRFASSLLALAMLTLGVPITLVSISQTRFGSGNPLAGATFPWNWSADGISNALSEPLSDDSVLDIVIRSSLCVVWLATAVIVVSTAVELAHMIRHRGLSMPLVRGISWAQRPARFIAIGLLVLIPVMSPRTSIASIESISFSPAQAAQFADQSGSVPGQVGQVAGDPAADPAQSPSEITNDDSGTPTVPAPSVHVVKPGESVYSIAADLANGVESKTIDIADAILELNLNTVMTNGHRFSSPAYIEAGWELSIPASVARRAPTTPSTQPTPTDAHDELTTAPSSGPQSPDAALTHVVQPGDTLWGIAESVLGEGVEWSRIWEQNAGADMGGGRTFDDPNLILPGWELSLPINAGSTTAEAHPQSGADTTSPPTSTSDVAPSATATNAAPDGSIPATTAPAIINMSGSSTSTTEPTIAATNQGGDGSDTSSPEGDAPASPSPIRLEHAALLAGGILALVAVRRRQRLRAAMPRSRVPQPPEGVVATERRLRTIDAGERATRIDVACRAAANKLIETDSQIGWVRASAEGDVELRLTEPAELPAPWEGDGQQWTLPAGVPIELLSESARMVAMPSIAFVQIGVTDSGDDVLVDLEACGLLAIEAQPVQADEVVTAIAAGLASSLYAEVAHLISVSLPEQALLGHRNSHHTSSVDAAIELVVSLVGTTLTDERTSFALRSLRTGGEVWEPAIILLRSDDDTDQIVTNRALPAPGHGLAVVAAAGESGLPIATTRLLAEPGGWTFHAFGSSVQLCPIGISQADLDDVVDVLADAAEPLDQNVAVLDPGETQITAESNDPAADSFVEPAHEIIVGLMGSVTITDRGGNPGKFERSKTVELIAWLATHRDRATRAGARTALWELDVRDATFANVVSEARRALGRLVMPPDGEEWLARTLTEQLPIHDAVLTDAQLIQQRLDHARVLPPLQAVQVLRPAVELIRDVPFAGTGYLWPDAEGITSNMVLLAISAASELAAHALSLGDTEAVFWATGQGLKVLPGHEELIGLRMRAHARAGDLAGVRQEWESYERVIVADAWSDGEPAPKLLALRRDLLTSA